MRSAVIEGSKTVRGSKNRDETKKSWNIHNYAVVQIVFGLTVTLNNV